MAQRSRCWQDGCDGVEQLNEKVEELEEKLDNISNEVSSAKDNLENARFFHIPGSLDDLEDNLNNIETECDH